MIRKVILVGTVRAELDGEFEDMAQALRELMIRAPLAIHFEPLIQVGWRAYFRANA